MTARTDSPPRTAYTVPEVAASLGYSKRHVYRMCESGELAVIRSGRTVRIPVKSLEAYLATAATA